MTVWLIDTLVWMTILMLLVLIIREQVARHFGRQATYCLWLIPAARAFMPVRETTVMPPITSDQAANVAEAVRDALFSAPVVTASTATPLDWVMIIIAVWLGGAATLLLFELNRYRGLRTKILRGREIIETQNTIHIVESSAITGPVAFGIVRKYIAVPATFAQDYTVTERELVIAHEMAHHRAGDLMVNFAAFLMLCLHWFNPVAWASWRAFRFDQEAACDVRVLAKRSPHEREIYGRALTKSATQGRLTFATALTPKNTLIQRLRILTMKEMPKSRRLIGIACISAAIAISLPLTATVIAAPAAPEPEPKTAQNAVRTIILRSHGADEKVDGKQNVEHRIESNGSTILIKADHKLSDDELAKITDEAKSIHMPPASVGSDPKIHRKVIIHTMHSDDKSPETTSAYPLTPTIPEIDIKEVTVNCKDGESMTTNTESQSDDGKAKVTIVMCGKGNAKIARLAAVEGLESALASIKDQKDLPESVRKDVIEKLKAQIKRLEKEAAEEKS
ncbi:MAG: M56 family metallopeptidase [Chakrabartia sp.]